MVTVTQPLPEHDPDLWSAHDHALLAAELLVASYRAERSPGGSIDWSDVDEAHRVARLALLDFVRHRRTRRRRGGEPARARVEVPSDVRDALATVLDYLDDERRDFDALGPTERAAHIWNDVRRLRRWLDLLRRDDLPRFP